MRCSNNSQIPSTAKLSCEYEAVGVSFCAPLWSIANKTVSWFTGNNNHLQNIYVQEIAAAWMNVSSGNSEIGTCLQVVILSFDLSRNFVPFRQPSENVLWAASGIKNSKNLTCRISEVDISVGCVRREDRLCLNNSIRFNEFKVKGDSSRMTFFVSETNNSYAIEDSLYTQRFRWNTDNSSNLDADLLVCRRSEYPSQCALITLDISDFVIWSNGSVLYEPYNMVFDTDDYALVNNDSIQVCSFLDGSGTLIREYYFIQFSKGQSITSFVGCLLSIAGLVFTFVTYAKFGSLRKSICSQVVMSICVSLTLAQLTLLFSGMAKSNSISCTCFAVLGHYLWLVVFTHSVALALDLYRRFGITQKVKKTSEGPKLLSMFLIFSWGSPLLIVIPCLVVHLCKLPHVALTYGTAKSCWIGNGFMNLYAFGVPIALTLVVNGTLFLLVVAGLRKRTNQTTKRKTSKMVTEGVVYLKMSTLLGFTWIFGFIAAFVDVEALWYIFIILNSLQGVYIFIAFICNKRVFKLWRDSCSCKPCVSLTVSCPCLRSSSDESSSSIKTASSTWTSSFLSSTKKGASSTSISMTEASSSYSVPEKNQNQIETDSSALKGPIPVLPSSSPSECTDRPVNVQVSSQLMSELKMKFDRKVNIELFVHKA
ncbi:adhesion G-protein coupled receptor D1-like [Strongylocentrotus purpuratus]|uniref:G-protein coupled receptors family 2 profile 2 domain-containing protein n=1 Tax=Strongylocentrotus purpuratus TaxID=7668 RepID=A0A7M7HKM6_STRPU|nr:adhesion G-protein coupled receptor D1-like [Strongylocentrotus purpuratus]